MLGSYSLFCFWFVSISDPSAGCTWVYRRLNRGVLVQGMGMVGDRCPEFTLENRGMAGSSHDWVCVWFGHILCVLLRSFKHSVYLRPDLHGSEIFSSVCVCVCVCVCACVGRGEVSQPASHGGDLVAVGSRLPEWIHSSLMASCFPGFSWALRMANFCWGPILQAKPVARNPGVKVTGRRG